jgi:hypothetical protein
MKPKSLIVWCALLLSPTIAFSQIAPPGGPGGHPRNEDRRKNKPQDRNNDGKVAQHERKTSKQRKEELLKQYDTNKDGKLSREEREKMDPPNGGPPKR